MLRGPSDSKLGHRAQRVCGPPAPCHGHRALGEGQRHSPQPVPSLLLPKQQVEAPTAREACRGLDSALGVGVGAVLSQCLPLARVADTAGCRRRGSPAGPAIPLRGKTRSQAPSTPHLCWPHQMPLRTSPASPGLLSWCSHRGPAGCLSEDVWPVAQEEVCRGHPAEFLSESDLGPAHSSSLF